MVVEKDKFCYCPSNSSQGSRFWSSAFYCKRLNEICIPLVLPPSYREVLSSLADSPIFLFLCRVLNYLYEHTDIIKGCVHITPVIPHLIYSQNLGLLHSVILWTEGMHSASCWRRKGGSSWRAPPIYPLHLSPAFEEQRRSLQQGNSNSSFQEA